MYLNRWESSKPHHTIIQRLLRCVLGLKAATGSKFIQAVDEVTGSKVTREQALFQKYHAITTRNL